jgi:hypothetical protein
MREARSEELTGSIFRDLKQYESREAPLDGTMADQAVAEGNFLTDVQAFVREKWKGTPCDRCGNLSWAILPGDANVVKLDTYNTNPRSGLYGFPARGAVFIPVYCDNCGNTVAIYSEVFEEWRRARNRTT